ncbi:hypothetical protein CA51_47790 [Rosistilla oblonga]|uniref:DUF1501 domain-containing protein n=1 Tax=Rosistilla oblonga TaxID=2527990 RepID=UPI001189683F|nr:DUF1501 domain-containing protein [Rosistilla oblonga]QDV14869.1 hypothetical protein CA51_47790 [Rosistilla oblonga]
MKNVTSRRQMLSASACGFGSLALADLMTRQAQAATPSSPLAQPSTHHLPRARRVIFLFMHGGPSHVDTFDYKPRLQADDGKDLPYDLPTAAIDAKLKLLGSPWKFKQHGQSGLWCSELMPHTARHLDEMCIIKSLHSRGQSHGQAVSMLNTGSDNLVRPSVGSWLSYGLGTENEDLPSFVALAPSTGHGGPRNYGTAFLPAIHQATAIGSNGKLGDAQVKYLNRGDLPPAEQNRQMDLLQTLNRRHLDRAGQDQQIEGAIEAYELAFRMQQAAPQVLSLDEEPQHILDLYGVGQEPTDNFGRSCLLARRLAEAGVRFVQVSTGNVWDQHSNLKSGHEKNSLKTDQPVAGLIQDLKQRGMLEDTLIVWGGEFGRTPVVQGANGRDHNPQGFTMWMAGGGVKGGTSYGETDEFGYYSQQDRVHMHDLHATILHLMGLDHQRLTYRYAGRDFRLTDVAGRVVTELFA